MPRIRLRPLEDVDELSTREIRAAVAGGVAQPAAVSADTRAPLLLGMPRFDLGWKGAASRFIPVAHIEAGRAVYRRIRGTVPLQAALEAEYRGVVKALCKGGCPFYVVNLDCAPPRLRKWLEQRGARGFDISEKLTGPWLRYPRDMFVYFADRGVLLAHEHLFQLNPRADCAIRHSSWAEGGRVLFSGDRVLVGRYPEGRVKEKRVLDELAERGLRVGVLPLPLFYRVDSRYKPYAIYHDEHLDRVASLQRDRAGGFHLLLDCGYRTGPLLSPQSADKSLDLVRRACDEIEVEVHQLGASALPYGMSTVQDSQGKILVSGGVPEGREYLESWVGKENVHVATPALEHYPVFAGAGLHCLVTEMPAPLL